MDHANGYEGLGAVAMESAVSLYGRLFWWPACLTPPFVLLVEMYTARTAQSADTALGAAFIEVPLYCLVFFAGAVLVVLAAISRVLTKREQSFLSTLGIKRATRLRRGSVALRRGDYAAVGDDPDVFAYRRRAPGQTVLVALNMSGVEKSLPASPEVAARPLRVLLSSNRARAVSVRGAGLRLAPWEALVVELPRR